MKKYLVLAIAFGAIVSFTSCKSSESAYRKAYEKAQAQERNQANSSKNDESQVVVANNTNTTPVQQQTTTSDSNVDVRTIAGGITVVNGSGIKAYSVVVGSFSVQTNAEGLQSTLKEKGYSAQVVKTNETINGITGWYRVIASTYDDKSSAIQSREQLKSLYPDAWLLYNK